MKKWVKRILFLIIIIAIISMFLLKKPEEATTYRTIEAKIGNIETIVSGTGTLVASKERKEYSKVTSEISEIYHSEGEIVEEGNPLVKLDSSSYESTIKAQEISIKQAELSKQNIQKQIDDLKIIAENDGYVSGLTIATGSYVTNSMAICNVVKDNKYEIVLQFAYFEDNPITVGANANVTLASSFSTLVGKVVKVSDMRKLIAGNAQVIDVTIEVETTGYSLVGAEAKAEVSNGVRILQSTNSGIFNSVNSNIIRSKTNGTVKEVLVNEGKKIKVGDVIAILENSDLQTNLNNVNLTIENLNNQLAIMKKNIEDYTIKASITGTITKQDVEIGDMVAAGTMITSIANKDVMEFIVPIDELDIAKLNYDQEVRVSVDALSETEDNPIIGEIIEIPHEGVTIAGVTDYYVTIQVVGNDKMKISMNANADIVVESVKDVLYIPIDALIRDNGKRYVEVLLDDGITIEKREVETGASDITNIEIKDGLNEGEKVIVPEINSVMTFF